MKLLKEYWKIFSELRDSHREQIQNLQKELSALTDVYGVEFFLSDTGWGGVGDAFRDHRLVHWYELEEDDKDRATGNNKTRRK